MLKWLTKKLPPQTKQCNYMSPAEIYFLEKSRGNTELYDYFCMARLYVKTLCEAETPPDRYFKQLEIVNAQLRPPEHQCTILDSYEKEALEYIKKYENNCEVNSKKFTSFYQ